MATSGGQPGNTQAGDGKVWKRAIKNALARRGEGDYEAGLRRLADKLLDKAEDGDFAALQEVGNRFDGKPAQIIAGDDELPPVSQSIAVHLVGIKSDA